MSQSSRPPGNRDRGVASQLGEYAGFGLTLAGATALFAWLGTLADRWLHTEPLFVLVGAFLGFAAGFYHMYSRLVLRTASHDEDDETRARGRGA